MTEECLLSAGIDIGTSTTHCIFSRLKLRNRASAFSVPKVDIAEKEILYRSPLRLTPLLSADTVDAVSLQQMIAGDYAAAGLRPEDIRLGAVIITGETAKKHNARAVTEALSRMAGEFVVATAGPALESILAGRGSGAAELSASSGRRVMNLDIGGGTTNIAVFDRGEPVWDACLELGGRLARFAGDDCTLLSYTPAMAAMAADAHVTLAAGKRLTAEEQERICRRMAQILEEAAGLREPSPLLQRLTMEKSSLPFVKPDWFTFSGGVADCVYGTPPNELNFHDFGQWLGKAVASSRFFEGGRTLRPRETSRATVIGAGAYSAKLSGSTIFYQNLSFPLLALPAGSVKLESEADLPLLPGRVREQQRVFGGKCAICMKGIHAPSFQLVEALAEALAGAMEDMPLKVVVLEEDMAKALGQALSRRWSGDTGFLCMDGIRLGVGDTLDIGSPVSGGRALPVVVKTLVFSGNAAKQE